MARISLVDANAFLQLMQATATDKGVPETSLWEGLLNQWWRRVRRASPFLSGHLDWFLDKFDNMSEPHHRKLAAMGIGSLVATGRPEVMERLSTEIFNLWIDVFGEMKEAFESYQESLDDPRQALN